MRKNLGLILCQLILIISIFAVYFPVTKTFYQQDEWASIGAVLVDGSKFIFQNTYGLTSFILGQGRILSNLFNYILFSSHPFNLLYVSLFGIFWHALNSVLVFFLARKFIKSLPASLLASLFFAFNSVAQQAVIWPSTAVNTLPSTTLIILSIFTFLKYLGERGKWLGLTFLLLYVSLFFKESGVYLFLFYPVFSAFYLKLNLKEFFKSFWLFILFITLAVVARLWQFGNISSSMNLFVTGSAPDFLANILLRLIYYPLTSFSLTFLPAQTMLELAKTVTKLYYSFIPGSVSDLVAQSAVLDGIAILSTFTLIIFFITYFKGGSEKKLVLLLLGIFIFSFLPYAIIIKSFAYLESRYYYLASVPAAILLGMLWQRFFSLRKAVAIFSVFVFAFFLMWHISTISSELRHQIVLAAQRRGILNEISTVKPSLDPKTVFYFTGNRSYYTDSGNNLPLQQGLGYTLAVWYYGRNRSYTYLSPLIGNQFLWDLGSQGYQENQGNGFGYYWQVDELKKQIKLGKFNKENVVGFYYDSDKMLLRDITRDVRGQL